MRELLPCPVPRTGPRIYGSPFPADSGAPLFQVLPIPRPFPILGPRFFRGPALGSRQQTVYGSPSQAPSGAPQWGPVYFCSAPLLVCTCRIHALFLHTAFPGAPPVVPLFQVKSNCFTQCTVWGPGFAAHCPVTYLYLLLVEFYC